MSQRAFNYLLFRLSQNGLDEKLPELLYIFKNELPESSAESIHGISELFNELERRYVVHVDDLEPLKEALELVERRDLVEQVLEFERKRDRQGGVLQRCGFSRGKISLQRNALRLGKVTIYCNFRTISGGVVVVGAAVILRRCASLQEFMEAFTSVVLPAASTLRAISEGSLCFTVEAETLSALQELWEQYQDGSLQSGLQSFLVTEDIKQMAGGHEVRVITYIDEQEYREACLDLMILQNKDFDDTKKRSNQRRRSNSDSTMYFQSREDKFGMNLPESEIDQDVAELGTDFFESERSAFVQRYLEKLNETNSVTTDTTDSGLGAQTGASSVVGMDDDNDIGNGLRCKDLNDNIIEELSRRLQNDKAAWRNVCEAFELKGLGRDPSALKDVIKLFPDTPVKMFKELFETLQMYDLVELLANAKPMYSSLRLRRSLDDVKTLRKTVERQTTYHSSAAVLIVDGHENIENSEKIREFFIELNSNSDVTIIRVDKSVLTKLHGGAGSRLIERAFLEKRKTRELKEMEMREREQREKVVVLLSEREREVMEDKEAQEMSESGQKVKELGWRGSIQREMEQKKKELRELREERDRELREVNETERMQTEKIKTTTLETMNRWIDNQGRFSLFAFFEFANLSSERRTVLQEIMTEKLRILSSGSKFVISSSSWKAISQLCEILHVTYSYPSEDLAASVHEILNKRWKTLDMLSMMEELNRTFGASRRNVKLEIKDKLSSLLRLQKTEDIDRSSVYATLVC